MAENGNPTYHHDGKFGCGYSINFDGDGDFFSTGVAFPYNDSDLTILIYANYTDTDHDSLNQLVSFHEDGQISIRYDDSLVEDRFDVVATNATPVNFVVNISLFPPASSARSWFFGAVYDNGGGVGLKAYNNTDAPSDTNTTLTGDLRNNTDKDNCIGAHPNTNYGWEGYISHVECLIVPMTDEWMRTRANMFLNASDGGFFSLGNQRTQDASSFSLEGLPQGRVTFQGTSGSSVWCNETGTTNEWLNISMNINASDNVTVIRVFMDDLNNTGPTSWINASNITMYVSSDNSSYGEMGTFTDGGSNCSNDINASNWNAGTMGADPFAGAGLTDKNASIFCIFLLSIPADAPTDMFWSSASDSCKVYIGYYS
jgi:hypothetical protein